MTKWMESTGRNEEEAIAAALEELKLERDDVSVEVLERAKTGFLGIGSTPAKVRVSFEAPEEEIPSVSSVEKKDIENVEAIPIQTITPMIEKDKISISSDSSVLEQESSLSSQDLTSEIETFLVGLLGHMGVHAKVDIQLSEKGNYQVCLVGEDLGSIIGRRGETLDAIQQLTSYSVNRNKSKRCRIHLDAENYRAKREEALIQLAQRVAGKVVNKRRNVTLEPMNAYERHVIHTALQDNTKVSTYSTGHDPNRRVVVSLAK